MSAFPEIVGLAAAGGVAASASASWAALRASRRTNFQVERLVESVEGGAIVLLDYADRATLETIAGEYGIQSGPVEIEQERGGRTTRRLSGMFKGFGAGKDRETNEHQREVFRQEIDYNVLADRLLVTLHARGAIQRGLEEMPAGISEGLSLADELKDRGLSTETVNQVRREVTDVNTADIRIAKHKEYQRAAEHEALALIRGQWIVADKSAGLIMELASTADPAGELTMKTATGFGLDIHLPPTDREASGWTTRGEQRLAPGGVVSATVLGTATRFDPTQGNLVVTPIAVLSLLEKKSNAADVVAEDAG
jgi:hypothetical protein